MNFTQKFHFRSLFRLTVANERSENATKSKKCLYTSVLNTIGDVLCIYTLVLERWRVPRRRIYFYLPPCLWFRSNFRGNRISKNNERVRGEHLRKITIPGHLFREKWISRLATLHGGNSYRFSVRQVCRCCFCLESRNESLPSFLFSSSPPLLAYISPIYIFFFQIRYTRAQRVFHLLSARSFLSFFLFSSSRV